jgi:Holliday junction resolvasome RuvABC DNA-binding subunit
VPDIVHGEIDVSTVDSDACTALITAGFKLREARAAVAEARPHVGADATLEQVLREALRRCAAPARSEWRASTS